MYVSHVRQRNLIQASDIILNPVTANNFNSCLPECIMYELYYQNMLTEVIAFCSEIVQFK